MNKELSVNGRKQFSAMQEAMQKTYNVADASKHFAVDPTVEQRLQDAITDSVAFWSGINVVAVDDIKSQKVLGVANGIIGKRTDTDAGDRQTTDVMSLGEQNYELFFTESDTHIRYITIDAWSKFPDFKKRYGKWVRTQIALGRMKVGWHGVAAAAVTDLVANPNGEDVNRGWIQALRDYNGGSQMFDEGATVGEIQIGAGGDFENLDAAVHGAIQMLHPNYQSSDDLVAIVGRELLATEKSQLYTNQAQTPTEKERIENSAVVATYGGLPTPRPPSNFPARGLLVTSLDNLSYYYQSGSVRRAVTDNPKRNRIEDYQSTNDGYIVEDELKAAAFEFANVRVRNAAADAWI